MVLSSTYMLHAIKPQAETVLVGPNIPSMLRVVPFRTYITLDFGNCLPLSCQDAADDKSSTVNRPSQWQARRHATCTIRALSNILQLYLVYHGFNIIVEGLQALSHRSQHAHSIMSEEL